MMTTMHTYSLAERPDLVDQFWGVRSDWPAFMLKDPVAATHYEPSRTVRLPMETDGLVEVPEP